VAKRLLSRPFTLLILWLVTAPVYAAESTGTSFEAVARHAAEALRSGRLDEALDAYTRGVAQNPQWADGWWQMGLIYFDRERFGEGRQALSRLVQLEPETGPAWALLGFCDYQLGDYVRALDNLKRALELGLPPDHPMFRPALHHQALLLVRSGDFRASGEALSRLVRKGANDPELILACGLMALRMARLPSELAEDERPPVLAAGLATYAALSADTAEARKLFATLVERFPNTRGAHLIYGLFLSRDVSQDALVQLQREVELFPDNYEAQIETALFILERGNAADALAPASAAVRLEPQAVLPRLALGRALVARGKLEEGILQLEEASRLGPESADVCLALAAAYARAGREQDVERVRARLAQIYAVRERQEP